MTFGSRSSDCLKERRSIRTSPVDSHLGPVRNHRRSDTNIKAEVPGNKSAPLPLHDELYMNWSGIKAV